MGTNKIQKCIKKLSVTVAAARKMEMSPEKVDDAPSLRGLQLSHPPGSYTYADKVNMKMILK